MDYAPYKELLLKMKEEALIHKDDVTTTFQSEPAADELDVAAQDNATALAKRLLERQQSYVRRIDIALEKIEEGTYGECEGCGDMISAKRLLARPVAVLCILCKEKQERAEKVAKSVSRGFTSET
jgi:DnaK suppressor protein